MFKLLTCLSASTIITVVDRETYEVFDWNWTECGFRTALETLYEVIVDRAYAMEEATYLD